MYNAPFGLSVGLQVYVRSGVPTSRRATSTASTRRSSILDQRGSDGRLPTDYEMNLSLAYNLNVGPGDDHAAALRLQPPQPADGHGDRPALQPERRLRDEPDSPFYGQAGVEPGTAGPDGNSARTSSPHPCTDNPDYRKATAQVSPRQFRFALKVTF